MRRVLYHSAKNTSDNNNKEQVRECRQEFKCSKIINLWNTFKNLISPIGDDTAAIILCQSLMIQVSLFSQIGNNKASVAPIGEND